MQSRIIKTNQKLGINRYIVGCKSLCAARPLVQQDELIDTQWDVNEGEDAATIVAYIELIDTQWDVNLGKRISDISVLVELIDTQWDVNKFKNAANNAQFWRN